MTDYFLDTSVVVSFLRNKGDVIKTLKKLDGKFASSFVVLAELYEGVFRVRGKAVAEEKLLAFFKKLKKVFGIDLAIAKEFGRIRSELKRKGEVIEDLDILIAATCTANNLILLTQNVKHFERIKELRIIEV